MFSHIMVGSNDVVIYILAVGGPGSDPNDVGKFVQLLA